MGLISPQECLRTCLASEPLLHSLFDHFGPQNGLDGGRALIIRALEAARFADRHQSKHPSLRPKKLEYTPRSSDFLRAGNVHKNLGDGYTFTGVVIKTASPRYARVTCIESDRSISGSNYSTFVEYTLTDDRIWRMADSRFREPIHRSLGW